MPLMPCPSEEYPQTVFQNFFSRQPNRHFQWSRIMNKQSHASTLQVWQNKDLEKDLKNRRTTSTKMPTNMDIQMAVAQAPLSS